MTTLDTDLLAELIRGRRDRLTTLRDMGRKQLDFVKADQTTELLDLLAAKQRVLVELQGIERQLAPFRDQDPDQRRWRTTDQRQECARQLDECDTLLREIVTREKQSERELTRRRDDLAAQLQGMHLAGQARGAYTAQSRPAASRIDLTSES
ncbi:MAG TPA: hypothetical protein VMY37_20020 [Thermoguttaceae bacterium]|nr:hypothetical protein [Thermoguttaceae bacterium]